MFLIPGESDFRPSNLTTYTTMMTSPLSPTTSNLKVKEKPPEFRKLDDIMSKKKHNDTTLQFRIPVLDTTPAMTPKPPTIINIITPVYSKTNSSKLNITSNGRNRNRSILKTSPPPTTTPSPTTPTPTRKKIYIRGHLLQARSRTFHPASPEDIGEGDITPKGPVPQKHMGSYPKSDQSEEGNVGCPPTSPECGADGDEKGGKGQANIAHIGMPARRKKKHSTHTKKKFYNYKLLYDTLQVNVIFVLC